MFSDIASTTMHSVWQSLAWKEWHEHKWRLAALVSILCGLMLFTLVDSEHNRDVFGGVLAIALLAVGPLAIFAGACTAASERSRGTLAFLQALPVPMWRVALHKLAFGLLTVVVPCVCLMVLVFAYSQYLKAMGIPYHAPFGNPLQPADRWTTGNWIIDWGLVFMAISASLYLWTIAAGACRNDEISAGAFGLLAMVGCWIVLIVAGSMIYELLLNPRQRLSPAWDWLLASGLALGPGSAFLAFDRGFSVQTFAAVPVALAVHAGLALLYVRRFHSAIDLAARSPQVVKRAGKRHDWLRPPFATTWTAIAWKQFRESLPVALAGLGGILAIATVLGANLWVVHQDYPERIIGPFVRMFGAVSVSLGMFIALVIGIGVALNDTGTKLAYFWRSRPINSDVWYWTKFATGLLLLIVTLYLPLLVLAATLHPVGLRGLWSSEAIVVPPLQLALFTTSLALTCLLRQAIYAAVLSIAVIYLGMLPAMLVWGNFVPEWVPASCFLITAIVMSIVGWLAMRNDWGRRV